MFLRAALLTPIDSVSAGSTPWVLGLLVALVSIGCGKTLTSAECDKLLDHYTENLLRNENPAVAPRLIAEKQQAARGLAREEPAYEFERCAKAVSRRQFDCAMTAHDVDSIERCLTL